MRKFNYAVRLNPSEKGANRVCLIDNATMLAVINGQRTFFHVEIDELPFTAAIRKAYKDVCNDIETEYFNIGEKPSSYFVLDDSDLLHINYMMFLYVMRRAQGRHVWNKSLPNYFTSYVREDIMSSMYIHRLKLATLRALTNQLNPRTDYRAVMDLYRKEGFPAGTARLYMLYWNCGEALHTVKDLCDTNEPFVLDFEALLEETNIIVAESNLKSLADFQASRRLAFLASSNRYDSHDFSAELLNRSRTAYIHCRPFLSRQHAINYARATISSYALRMLQHYQSPDRARLLTMPDGSHDNRFVALDDSYADADGMSVEDKMIANIDHYREVFGDW